MYQAKFSPSSKFIPDYSSFAQTLYSQPALIKWNKARSWETFVPRDEGQWAPYGWSSLFGPSLARVNVVQVMSGLHVAYQLSSHIVEVATDVSRLITEARPLFSGPFDNTFTPEMPEPPARRAYTSEAAAKAALEAWQEVCLDNLAFF